MWIATDSVRLTQAGDRHRHYLVALVAKRSPRKTHSATQGVDGNSPDEVSFGRVLCGVNQQLQHLKVVEAAKIFTASLKSDESGVLLTVPVRRSCRFEQRVEIALV